MSGTSLAHDGLALVDAAKHAAAVPKLTAALESSRSPVWLLARAKAYTALNEPLLALADANEAWHAALSRGRRQLMMDAQYRRAVAYLRLGRYADADRACVWTVHLADGGAANSKDDPTAGDIGADGVYGLDIAKAQKELDERMRKKKAGGMEAAMKTDTPEMKMVNMVLTIRGHTLKQLQGLVDKGEKDGEGIKAVASMVPDVDEGKSATTTAADKSTSATSAILTPTTTTSTAPAPANLRTQDFQTATQMTISILSKGNDASALAVHFTPTTVRIDGIKYPDGQQRDWRATLGGEIDPDHSTYHVTPSKVELRLRKKDAGTWGKSVVEGAE
jgi:suppressor of G2 allele of SKP1